MGARAGVRVALGLPVKFSETPGGVTRAAPLPGQHTSEVLGERGFTDSEIAALIAARAIHQAG